MKLNEMQRRVQDLACKLNYSTKQDKYLALGLQKSIDAALQRLEQILRYSKDFADLDAESIRVVLTQELSQDPGKHNDVTDLLDQLDELESLFIQIRLMQDAEPEFVYKETIQPYNQV